MREYKKVDERLSDEDARVVVKAVEADFRMEGMFFTDDERRLLFAVAKGDVSEVEALHRALAKAGVTDD